MSYPSGAKVTGNWDEDQLAGKAVFKYANGDIYDGNFSNGIRQGYGKYKYYHFLIIFIIIHVFIIIIIYIINLQLLLLFKITLQIQ